METIKKTVLLLFFTAIIMLPLIGWVMNLVKFTQLDFKAPYKAEIIRGVCITSCGVITGYIKINDN